MWAYHVMLESMIARKCPQPPGLDFRRRYWEARKVWPVELPFSHDVTNIVIHLRKGDTACVRVGGQWIDPAHDPPRRVESPSAATRRQTTVGRVERLAKAIMALKGIGNTCVLVLTDGYDMAMRRIRSCRSLLGLSETQLTEAATECYHELATLGQIAGVTVLAGESAENLFASIHAIASADVVVHSDSGFSRDLPRFLRHPGGVAVDIPLITNTDEEILRQVVEFSQQRHRSHRHMRGAPRA
jgi:hypothetical protein